MTVDADALAAEQGFALPRDYNAARLLWDNLAGNAGRTALVHDGGTTTYRALAAEAGRIGNHLRTLAGPGDRVLLLLDDEPAYPAAIMGAMRAGLVPILVNTLSPPDLVRFMAEDGGACATIASPAFVDQMAAALGDLPVARLHADARPWKDAPEVLAEHPTGPDDAAFLMYSSGSTGRPKGVVHRHADAAYVAHTYARHVLGIGPDDVCFSVPKIFFAYGFGNSVAFPFSVGAASVLLAGRPTPERVFEAIRDGRPTILFGLPTLYTALAADDGIGSADLGSLRLCVSAAEVLSPELARDWEARFGLPIVEGLGSTEMLHIYLSNTQAHRRPGSAGRVVPGYAVRLTTLDGREAADGEEGIMQVCGPSAARRYWRRPDKTAETMAPGGWIDTGDRFTRDADGFHYFRGRADDLVKVSGQWVWPLEIEHALNDHARVREACVLALPLADGRMTIKAWVTPIGAGDDALASDLRAWTKGRLLPHKYPREIAFVDALPKTGTDKIDRQALRRMETAP